ncbi:MAG: MFS transporter [Anaeromyxobacter sp.]
MSTTAAARERFPGSIWYLAWNEAAERFSYYGMTSILTLHLVQHMGIAKNEAVSWYSYFVAAVYLMPLVGGVLADRWWGRYHTILWLSFGYVAGHLTIAFFESPAGMIVGCALIAIGSGGIKPNASAYAGDQIPKGNKPLLERLYDLWYWMINVGSLSSQFAVPWLYEKYGPRVAFGTPAAAMALALVLFLLGRKQYVRPPPSGPSPHGFLRVLLDGFSGAGASWGERALAKHPADAVEGVKAVFRIGVVFAAVSAFWSLFFQYGSTWTLQAEEMNRALGDYTIPAGQVQTLDALFVLSLIPVLTFLVYPAIEKRVRLTALRKMAAGMFIMVIAFLITAAVEGELRAGHQLHVAWQIPQYFFLAVAEVLVSVTALEFAYTQAPASFKSAIMGMWFLTFFVGSLLTGIVSALNRFQGVGFYLFFAALQLVAAVAFAGLARWYPERPAAGAAAQPAA